MARRARDNDGEWLLSHVVGTMTNHERHLWARAGYPRSVETAKTFLRARSERERENRLESRASLP